MNYIKILINYRKNEHRRSEFIDSKVIQVFFFFCKLKVHMMSYKYGTKLIKKVENKRKRRKREGIEWASAIKVWQVAGIYYTQEFNGGDNVIVARGANWRTPQFGVERPPLLFFFYFFCFLFSSLIDLLVVTRLSV